MAVEIDRVLDEIGVAVRAAGSDVDELERTLTDGYAHALELETERARLEKRLARTLESGGGEGELASLATSLDGASADLGRLRDMLAVLRRRVSAARAER